MGRRENIWGITNIDSSILLTQLSFTRSGVYETNSYLIEASLDGYYWSRTNNGATKAYYLNFGSSHFNPLVSNVRSRGFTLRCLGRERVRKREESERKDLLGAIPCK